MRKGRVAPGRARPDLPDQRNDDSLQKGSTARKLVWAVLGVIAYAIAKYLFGF